MGGWVAARFIFLPVGLKKDLVESKVYDFSTFMLNLSNFKSVRIQSPYYTCKTLVC